MFDYKQLVKLQEGFKNQQVRKAKLGVSNFHGEKIMEEIAELQEELNTFNFDGNVPNRIIEELGDVLFSLLADPIQSSRLKARLGFNVLRFEKYAKLDNARINNPQGYLGNMLKDLQYKEGGWVWKSTGAYVEEFDVDELLDALEHSSVHGWTKL